MTVVSPQRTGAGPASPGPPEEGALIVSCEDGPYLVRGTFVVRDQEGRELELTRRTVALCRCGRSRIRPLCDGTHRAIRFRAPGIAGAEAQARGEVAPALDGDSPPPPPDRSSP